MEDKGGSDGNGIRDDGVVLMGMELGTVGWFKLF